MNNLFLYSFYYNHYNSSTSFVFKKLTLFPVEFDGEYDTKHDFVIETDITSMLHSLLSFYVLYQLRMCECISRAAENVIRNQITSEALDKIEEIEKAIHNILHEGNKYYSPTALNVVLSIMGDHSTEKSITYTPSPRENEIIQMLSCGLTSDEIAHKLNLSKNTIDTMRKNILLKSGATNVSHLMRIAFLKGWITE